MADGSRHVGAGCPTGAAPPVVVPVVRSGHGVASDADADADVGIGWGGSCPRGASTVPPERRSRKLPATGVIWFVVAVFVLAACGGGGSSEDTAGAADAEGEGTAIERPEPTAEPTATATATATPEPTAAPTATAVPTATPGPEAEIIAAWERYLRLSIEARGKNPSPEALDFDSYVVGDVRQGLIQQLAEDRAAGRYLEGTLSSEDLVVVLRDDGAAVLQFCLVSELVAYRAQDDQFLLDEGELRLSSRARLDEVTNGWRVGATEFGPGTC